MFGKAAKQWREANPDKKGNIRDYASINELICLSNVEDLNAVFINDGMSQAERLVKLNKIAIQQIKQYTTSLNGIMQVLKGEDEKARLRCGLRETCNQCLAMHDGKISRLR